MEKGDLFLKFKELLSFVFENKYSDFYRLKYDKAGFNPLSDFNSLNDIKKIPFLNKEELSAVDPFKLLFAEEEEIKYISATSGTTGEPFLTFFSYCSDDNLIKLAKSRHAKHRIGERMLLLVNPIRAPRAFFIFQKIGLRVLVGDIHNLPASLLLASKLKIDTIATSFSLAIILKKYLENCPNLKKSLKYILLSGEAITPYRKQVLQKFYPNVKIVLEYGLSEAGGTVAFQCPFLAERSRPICYHPWTDVYFELINPETGKEVEFKKEGELVLTIFNNLATPLIRYKTGDLANFIKNDCSCGSPGPLLRILERAKYDIVKVGGVELRREMLEKPILKLKDYLENSFEAHIYENFVGDKPRIKMQLNLSLKKEVKESPELRQKIESELLENWRLSPKLNLKKAVEAGFFEKPQINFIQFPLSEKSRQVLILH